MIDIHSHILPNIDDGSKDIQTSIEMAKLYIENGFHTVIATPHYVENSTMDNSYYKNIEILNNLKKELKLNEIYLDIYLGNEIYICGNLLDNLKSEKITTLNNTKYILIELPFMDLPKNCLDMIDKLLKLGYIPVLAHPERNIVICKDINILYDLIIKGCLVQVNIPSIEGKYGLEIKEATENILKCNMVHFIGTDAHSNLRRSPNVARGIEMIKNIIGEEKFKNLALDNPKKILLNDDIDRTNPIYYKRKFRIKDIFRK